MTFPPQTQTCTMPTTQTRYERVPPAHPATTCWGNVDLARMQEDDLPIDPRSWERSHVGTWVTRCGGRAERFPMNGKALCLMSRQMFADRVPDQAHMLYQDFRRRLSRALALQELLEKLKMATSKN